MASPSGTLYTGVTNNLERRVWEHKHELHPSSFSARYGYRKLVYYEELNNIFDAIAREKQLKRWRREKKQALIKTINPSWRDLNYGWR